MTLSKIFKKLIKTRARILCNATRDCQTILDLGCGKDSPLKHAKATKYLVGVDLHKKSLSESKAKRIHDEYYCMDILNADRRFKNKSFDCVALIDVLEHLPKKEGLTLLKKAEKIARKKVILSTPNGFIRQEEYNDNRLQKHLSGWSVKDLKKEGYSVRGLAGLKYLKKEKAELRFKPAVFWWIVSEISQRFVYFFPRFAFELFGIKRLK